MVELPEDHTQTVIIPRRIFNRTLQNECQALHCLSSLVIFVLPSFDWQSVEFQLFLEATSNGEQVLPMMRLDSLFFADTVPAVLLRDKMTRVGLLKIDVEGQELSVLRLTSVRAKR